MSIGRGSSAFPCARGSVNESEGELNLLLAKERIEKK